MRAALRSVPAPALLAIAVVLAGCAEPQAQTPATRDAKATVREDVQAPGPVELANTTAHELPDPATGRVYPLWVDVPASYAGADKPLPVVFVTDATYSFPLVRSIRNLLGQRGRNIEDFVLVGLPPQAGLSSKESRSRDYTHSDPLRKPTDSGDYSAPRYGEAAAYRDYIERTVFPFVASNYRVDMSRKVFVGHSYGGLFGSYVLLTKPAMFRHYILGSPSLWFDGHSLLQVEAAYAATHQDLPADVMMYAGSFETVRPGPRFYKDTELVGDMQAFERRLRSRGYPSLRVGSTVIADEDHLTVFPTLVSRGLLHALPGTGPYISG